VLLAARGRASNQHTQTITNTVTAYSPPSLQKITRTTRIYNIKMSSRFNLVEKT
jgi:hypothetical protein